MGGIDHELVLIRKKGASYFGRRDTPIAFSMDCTQNPDAKMANEISEKLLSMYLSGETDTVELMYTKFVNLISSIPSTRTLVPLSASDIAGEEDEIFQLTSSSGDFSVEKTVTEAAEPQEFPNDMIFNRTLHRLLMLFFHFTLMDRFFVPCKSLLLLNFQHVCRLCRVLLTMPRISQKVYLPSITVPVRPL